MLHSPSTLEIECPSRELLKATNYHDIHVHDECMTVNMCKLEPAGCYSEDASEGERNT